LLHTACTDTAYCYIQPVLILLFSLVSFVPFPVGTSSSIPSAALNFTVESATSKYEKGQHHQHQEQHQEQEKEQQQQYDNTVLITTNATSPASASSANLSVILHAASFYGAFVQVAITPAPNGFVLMTLSASDLGTITAAFSQPPLPTNDTKGGCSAAAPGVTPVADGDYVRWARVNVDDSGGRGMKAAGGNCAPSECGTVVDPCCRLLL
jgi:hypothetical protein